MSNVMDTLRARGFIKQTVYEEDLYKMLDTESAAFYVGFDPTADSLHVGHYVPLVAMKMMQEAGHRPIILVGGGTGMVGDPSGRTDMRMLMTDDIIKANVEAFKVQMSKFLSFEGENAAIIVDNGDWLLDLNYVNFLRDVGVHFSVNRMLTAECFKQRMEKGLSFFEFNYMLMQAYDFLYLNQHYGVSIQLGGDDQWSNILAGADLIRRKEKKDAYAITLQLLTTSEGKKMGKTQKGALWLDRNKTTPFDFYQYWRNVEDADVARCFQLLTFVPLEEIEEICKYKDERINAAKERLAFEITTIIHSLEDAVAAQNQARAAFSGDAENMVGVEISVSGKTICDVLVEVGACKSKSDARRQVEAGAVKLGEEKISDVNYAIDSAAGEVVLHKGKKFHQKLVVLA